MNTQIAITLISTAGLVLVALIGVWVELVRTRKRADTVVSQVTTNSGSSLRDAVNRIESEVGKVRDYQVTQGERLAKVEAKVENWSGPGRRSTDGG